ncbi:MAG TPA: hypothetical protein VFC15_08505 [Candidatus Limnocylindrales bacterium]|jgi:hypothetical protein|nr:hypothetical protein [Candidatus Limnocylindrales bacterium]
MTGKKSRMLMVRSVVLAMEDFARLQAGEPVQGKRRSSRKAGEVLLLSISYAKQQTKDETGIGRATSRKRAAL